jgi:response regulator RpfG family c-di-GMP phosphodiesterase
MYRPPLRDRPALANKKDLLIDRCNATREARAAVLRTRGVEVHEAEELSAARFLWQPNVYDLGMLEVRGYSSDETREFYEQIKGASPRRRIGFITGPPTFISHTWPGEVASDGVWCKQWGDG